MWDRETVHAQDTVHDQQTVQDQEMLMAQVYDEGVVSEVIRPAAIIPEAASRSILVELALLDVRHGGVWASEPSLWSRYDGPWDGAAGRHGSAELIGTSRWLTGRRPATRSRSTGSRSPASGATVAGPS